MSTADLFSQPPALAQIDGDLALSLPLQGMRLIEASAGTGKTYTLAGIYTRLVVERRLAVSQILVVTFTKAATEELKSRLRARLVLCAEVAAGLHVAVEKPSAELLQSRILVAAALRQESEMALQARVRLASLELDTAQISTIHGFCQRALREQALDAGAAADGELEASDRDLIEIVAADLWRERAVANDAEGFVALSNFVGGAHKFARLLPRLLAARGDLLPMPQHSPEYARSVMRASTVTRAALAEIWREHGAIAFAALMQHAQAGHVNATSYPLQKIQQHGEVFALAFADGSLPGVELLERYTAAVLASSKCIKKNKPALPAQTFFEAVAVTLASVQEAHLAEQQLGMLLLRESILAARQRLVDIKREARRFSYDDLVRRLHDALHGEDAAELAQALREQYPVALVDEFQDTDAQQFEIFQTIYTSNQAGGETPAMSALLLIGDPKQAIYRFRGGDIHAYLAAREHAQSTNSLTANFRSTPGYLRALESLYTFSGAAAFGDVRIRFESVVPGGRTADDDLLIDDQAATPLTFWIAADEATSKADATERLAAGCAAGILGLLEKARGGRAKVRAERTDGTRDHRPLEPGDLAVLVNTHHEAIAMQTALSALNIPNVALSRRSVFATAEAQELHVLLDALIEFDEKRLRAALTTLLFGYTLADFVALTSAPARWSQALAMFAELREAWLAHGILAMLERVFEQRAAAVLALQGGERRMTNWLQLADLAQVASIQVIGQRGLADWLAQRIARADNESEDEQLRLESDADRVQVRTLHASKGLEYCIVFLPFAALRRSESHAYPRLLAYRPDGVMAASYLISDKEAAEQAQAQLARTSDNVEDLAERLRVLYVGLTRARCACFVAAGIFGKGNPPALLHLLRVAEGDNAATSLTRNLLDLGARAEADDGQPVIAAIALPEPADRRWRAPAVAELGTERNAARHLRERRSVYSFSRLSSSGRDEARAVEDRAGGDDEQRIVDAAAMNPLIELPTALRGPRFGTAFHEILEHTDFAEWRNWRAATPPPLQRELIDNTLRRHALIDAEASSNPIRVAVTRLIAATLNAPLPFGACLADLAPSEMRAELPFHFAIGDADAARWLQQMQQFGYLRERTRFVVDTQRLAGLMTGVLDLVVLRAGQWWVIDYKTNLLGASAADYAPQRLDQAVRDGEYDLQYLIYLVALHRWLKSRLGARYNYTRDIGGALYLFVRGLDAHGSNGVHRDCPPLELIEALDASLAAPREADP
jgi:exodeoxyribonuclease V beta subunit